MSTMPRPRAPRALPRARPLTAATMGALAMGALVVLAACGGARGGGGATAPGPVGRRAAPPPPDAARLYRGMGLIAHGEPFPITGRLSYLAGASPETTQVLVTVAIPNRALAFTHGGDRYHAGYAADLLVRRPGDPAAPLRVSAREAVVVATFRETTRTDESILFQQQLRLAPGRYEMQLRLRDEGSDRAVSDTTSLEVPRLGAGTLGTPVPYYEVVARERLADAPRVLAMPRATVAFGGDSTLPVYVEAYGAPGGATGTTPPVPVPVMAAVRGEDGAVVWRDSVALTYRGDRALASALLALPVARLGIGAATLELWRAGGGDTVRAPLFVTLGAGLPAATFEDMLSYLRFFAAPARLERLRSAPPAQRGAAWTAFLAGTGSGPAGVGGGVGGGGGGNARELQRYFARLQVADQRYAEDGGPGWLTDRGMVFAAFGDPDEIVEPTPTAIPTAIPQRGRVQLWVYRDRKLRLEFRDVTGSDRWRLAPSSEGAFQAALARLRA